MNDEEALAAILVAAAAFLLLLAVITLSVILSCTGRNKKRQMSLEIPTSKITHSSYNYGQENDVINLANLDEGDKNEETTSHTESHKADWPTNHNKYAISRSYEVSHYENPNSDTGNSSNEIDHKTFSEEVLSGYTLPLSATEEPAHNMETGSHTTTTEPNGNGIWKHQPASISTSHHSVDGHSITSTSTASHPRDNSRLSDQKSSYYSTFHAHHVYTSPAASQSRSHQSEQSTSEIIPPQQDKIDSTQNIPPQKIKLDPQEDNSSGHKIFTFNIA